jgi:hypothetical protein
MRGTVSDSRDLDRMALERGSETSGKTQSSMDDLICEHA